jgi:hypothetical protein
MKMPAFNRFAQALLIGLLTIGSAFAEADKFPVKTGDFNTILAAQSKALVIWQYAKNPDIYILDFPNLTQQGMVFNRITQLIEQVNVPYKHVLTNMEIEDYLTSIKRTRATMAYGNDVQVSNLVLFLNLADNDKVELNQDEMMLRDFAIAKGLIKVWRGFYQSVKPEVVILSIPQVQEKRADEPHVTDLARRTVFSHEISHGEYYTNAYYSNYCIQFWNNILTDEQKDAFKKFLSNYNYSLNRGDLIVNETQAYLMFTPDPSSFSAEKLGVSAEELKGMRKSFRKGMPGTSLPVNLINSEEPN